MKNPAPLPIKVLARLFVVWPTRLGKTFDAMYRAVVHALRHARGCVASGLAKLNGGPVLINGEVIPSTRVPTARVASEILGSHSTTVLDVGARWGGDGVWWRISPLAGFVGFDPDPAECERLNAMIPHGKPEKYVPVALGKANGKAKLYEAAQPACSSLYPPEKSVVERYPACYEIRNVKTHDVQLRRLDDWWREQGKPPVSFLKIDTQGSELDIMDGAREVMGNVLGCEIEVEFSAMYTGQPLFHQVDRYLREQGFVLWRLEGLTHYREQPAFDLTREEELFFEINRLSNKAGRLFWGNAIYFRDHREIPATKDNWKQLLTLAALLDAVGDVDAARSCVKRLLAEAGNHLVPEVKSRLSAHASQLF